jgi:hypothetical protein
MTLNIKVDAHEVTEALDQLDRKGNKQSLQKATTEGAKYLKPKLQAEARKVSRRMGRSVSARKARRGTPASIVKFGKAAWFAHFVIGGTRSHSTRRRQGITVQAFTDGGVQKFSTGHEVRGVRPNPIVSRVADREGDNALEAAERSLVKVLGLD